MKNINKIFDLDNLKGKIQASIKDIENQPGLYEYDQEIMYVVETLVSGAVGIYIPKYVVDIFNLEEQAEDYRTKAYEDYTYDPEVWDDVIVHTEQEIEDQLNEKFKSILGSYSLTFSHWEGDGSYCLILYKSTSDE